MALWLSCAILRYCRYTIVPVWKVATCVSASVLSDRFSDWANTISGVPWWVLSAQAINIRTKRRWCFWSSLKRGMRPGRMEGSQKNSNRRSTAWYSKRKILLTIKWRESMKLLRSHRWMWLIFSTPDMPTCSHPTKVQLHQLLIAYTYVCLSVAFKILQVRIEKREVRSRLAKQTITFGRPVLFCFSFLNAWGLSAMETSQSQDDSRSFGRNIAQLLVGIALAVDLGCSRMFNLDSKTSMLFPLWMILSKSIGARVHVYHQNRNKNEQTMKQQKTKRENMRKPPAPNSFGWTRPVRLLGARQRGSARPVVS